MVIFLPLINVLSPRNCESFGAYFECSSTEKEIEPVAADSDALACQNWWKVQEKWLKQNPKWFGLEFKLNGQRPCSDWFGHVGRVL